MHSFSFVTLLSGSEYVLPVVCLAEQLRSVQSRFRLVVVHSEVLSEPDRQLLTTALGNESQLIPTSELLDDDDLRAEGTTGPPTGRRLYHDVQRTLNKLVAWALPPSRFRRVGLIDTDVALLRNIDSVASASLNGRRPIAAVAQLPCSNVRFNSGLIVLQPSRATFESLRELAARRHSLPSQCEGAKGDQTVLNHLFRDRWVPLPHKFNVNKLFVHRARLDVANLTRDGRLAMLHLFGEPKPWSALRAPAAAVDPLGALWRRGCPRASAAWASSVLRERRARRRHR